MLKGSGGAGEGQTVVMSLLNELESLKRKSKGKYSKTIQQFMQQVRHDVLMPDMQRDGTFCTVATPKGTCAVCSVPVFADQARCRRCALTKGICAICRMPVFDDQVRSKNQQGFYVHTQCVAGGAQMVDVTQYAHEPTITPARTIMPRRDGALTDQKRNLGGHSAQQTGIAATTDYGKLYRQGDGDSPPKHASFSFDFDHPPEEVSPVDGTVASIPAIPFSFEGPHTHTTQVELCEDEPSETSAVPMFHHVDAEMYFAQFIGGFSDGFALQRSAMVVKQENEGKEYSGTIAGGRRIESTDNFRADSQAQKSPRAARPLPPAKPTPKDVNQERDTPTAMPFVQLVHAHQLLSEDIEMQVGRVERIENIVNPPESGLVKRECKAALSKTDFNLLPSGFQFLGKEEERLRAYRTQHNNYKREIEERARCLPRDPTDPNTGFAKEWLTYLKFYKREKLLHELEDLRDVVGQIELFNQNNNKNPIGTAYGQKMSLRHKLVAEIKSLDKSIQTLEANRNRARATHGTANRLGPNSESRRARSPDARKEQQENTDFISRIRAVARASLLQNTKVK